MENPTQDKLVVSGEMDLAASSLASRALDAIPLVAFIFDVSRMDVIYVNRAIEDVLGYTVKSLSSFESGLMAKILHPDDIARVPEFVARWSDVDGDAILTTEYRVLDAEGNWRWFQTTERALRRDAQGAVQEIVCIAHEITRERHLRSFLDEMARSLSSVTGGRFFDRLVRQLTVSTGFEWAFIGRFEEAPDRVSVLSVYGGGNVQDCFEYTLAGTPCEEVLETNTCVYLNGVQGLFPKDALLVEMGIHAYVGTPLHDSQGRIIGILVLLSTRPARDASMAVSVLEVSAVRVAAEMERQKANDELRTSEVRYRNLFDGFEQPITIYDDTGVIVHVNSQSALNLGVLPEECIGRPLFDFIPEMHDRAIRRGAEVLAANEMRRYEDRVPLPDGSVGWFMSDLSPIDWHGHPRPTLQTISYDVTSLRMAEAREHDEQQFQALLSEQLASLLQSSLENIREKLFESMEAIGEFIAVERVVLFATRGINDIQEPVQWVSPLCQQRDPMTADQAAMTWPGIQALLRSEGHCFFETHEDMSARLSLDRRALESFDLKSLAGVHVRRDGEALLVLLLITETHSRKWNERTRTRLRLYGEMLGTALHRTELVASLADSETRLRSILEHGSDLITWLSPTGEIRFASASIERILGYTPEDAVGHTLSMHAHPEDIAALESYLNADAGNPMPARPVEVRMQRRDETWRTLELLGRVVMDAQGGHSIVINARDITAHQRAEAEIRNLDAQFRQAQKMETVGQLAGGVAHDFNNLLQAIRGFTDLTLDLNGLPEQASDNLREIAIASDRATELVRQLLALSRTEENEREVLDLNAVVSGLENLVRRIVPESIEIDWRMHEESAQIRADRSAIEQAFLNLCVNARDAMSSGGRMTIAVTLQEKKRRALNDDRIADLDSNVVLSVEDTGHGIPYDIQPHVFEPFFTTKSESTGSGLGLAMAHNVAEQHGGRLAFTSAPGQGSTFSLQFPLVDELPSVFETPLDDGFAGVGHGTILLAEDDELVRNLTIRVLEGAGYDVLPADDGQQAVDVFVENRERIDGVILDIVMPRLGGQAVADTIRATGSEIPILFTTGYSHDIISSEEKPDDSVQLLRKPYRPGELLRVFRGMVTPAE